MKVFICAFALVGCVSAAAYSGDVASHGGYSYSQPSAPVYSAPAVSHSFPSHSYGGVSGGFGGDISGGLSSGFHAPVSVAPSNNVHIYHEGTNEQNEFASPNSPWEIAKILIGDRSKLNGQILHKDVGGKTLDFGGHGGDLGGHGGDFGGHGGDFGGHGGDFGGYHNIAPEPETRIIKVIKSTEGIVNSSDDGYSAPKKIIKVIKEEPSFGGYDCGSSGGWAAQSGWAPQGGWA